MGWEDVAQMSDDDVVPRVMEPKNSGRQILMAFDDSGSAPGEALGTSAG